MAAVKGRNKRRNARDAVAVGVRVHPEQRAKLDAIADALGVSISAYVERLIEREQLDDRGRPVWWDRPVSRDQEELLLPQSA